LLKGQIIAEYSTQASIPGSRRLKPVYTSMAGEIRFENLLVRKMPRDKRTVKSIKTMVFYGLRREKCFQYLKK
jgi:hypothetical protein